MLCFCNSVCITVCSCRSIWAYGIFISRLLLYPSHYLNGQIVITPYPTPPRTSLCSTTPRSENDGKDQACTWL